jgi:hypothetical protein
VRLIMAGFFAGARSSWSRCGFEWHLDKNQDMLFLERIPNIFKIIPFILIDETIK